MKRTSAPPSQDLFDLELLRSAVRYASPVNGAASPRWDCVARIFGVGLATAQELCQRFGYDPDEIREPR